MNALRITLSTIFTALTVLCFSCKLPLYHTDTLSPEVRKGIKQEIHEQVHDLYPFNDVKSGDRLQLFDRALESVTIDTSITDYVFKDELRRAVSLLRDGHTRLEWSRYGYLPGMRLRYIEHDGEGAIYVERCVGRDSIELQQGDKILSINGKPAEILFEDMKGYVYASCPASRVQQAANFIFAAATAGKPGEEIEMPISVEVERDGESRSLDVVLKAGETTYRYTKPFSTRIGATDGEVGYILVPTFSYVSDIDVLDRYINELMDTQALIFDIRGNSGGNSAVVDYLVGRLSRFPLNTFTLKNREESTVRELTPFSRGSGYAGKVVLLTDYLTFSAGNYFAHRLRDAQRKDRIEGLFLVGEKTGGGAGSITSVALTPELDFSVTETYMTGPADSLTENGVEVDVDVAGELSPQLLQQGYWSVPSENSVDIKHDLTLRRALAELGYALP
jgi:C-terminal processing protease CtpA/Prc